MSKKLGLIVIAFLIIVSLSFKFEGYVKAEPQELEISSVNRPLTVYVGNSFTVEIRITNKNTTISHNYTAIWWVDDSAWFTSRGMIEPGETISLTPSFTFSATGDHTISMELFEEETSIDMRIFTITAIKVDSSLKYAFDHHPIYPNTSFSLTLEVTNEGSETIYDASVRIFAIKGQLGIEPQFRLFTRLNNITAGGSNSTIIPFSVSYDTSPGIYSLKAQVKFYDSKGFEYTKNHYVPVQIASGEIRDKLDILEPQFELLRKSVRRLENDMQRNIIYIAILIIIVNAATATLNYWYTRKLARRARARAKILQK